MTTAFPHYRTLLAWLALPGMAFITAQRPALAVDFPVSIVAQTTAVKKCVTRTDNQPGWTLQTCVASPNQTFNYASGGGLMKLSTTNDCVGVVTNQPAALKAGASVSRMDCGTKSGALLNWRNQAATTQIVLVGSPNNGLCLNGDLNSAAGLTLANCSQTTTKFYNLTRYLAFHVHDSTGKDTGNCLADSFSGIGWTMQRCDPAAAGQHFMFDTSGTGSAIAVGNMQGNSESWECISAPASWNLGAPVLRQTACPLGSGPGQAPTLWRWTQGTRLVGAQSPGQSRCLTFDSNKGPGLFIGDCTKPSSLTAWDITLTTF